jgi:protein O-GlcNAc transferase
MDPLEIVQANARAAQLLAAGDLREAEACCRRILAASPADVQALHHLGIIKLRTGRLEESAELLGRAVAAAPAAAAASLRVSLSLPLTHLGRRAEAREHLIEAIRLDPSFAPAYTNLAVLLTQEGQWEQADAAFGRAVELQPDNAVALANLALAMRQRGRVDGAIEWYRKAIDADPKSAEAHNALGSCFRESGRIAEAIAEFRAATKLSPRSHELRSNLLYALYFDPQAPPQEILAEHLRWAESLRNAPQEMGDSRSFSNGLHNTAQAPAATRSSRLRIGYVSPDLRHHVIGFFMEPILKHHDREAFEVFCYADVAQPDEIGERLRQYSDVWHNTARLSDQQLARQIREDKIDILVDLTLHMRGNRLGVFALKPAPVQITHLAYCGTSGLPQMDWCVSDWQLSPSGLNEQYFTERLLRLPDSYWCYQGSATGPAVGPLPGLSRGSITFGSLNSFAKVNDQVIEAWAKILNQVPHARLAVHAMGGAANPSIIERFTRAGIGAQRLVLHDIVPRDQYLSLYNGIDIALDTFPYAGGTTSLDALWMGVPIVSLVGTMPTARTGLTLLKQVGLEHLAASSLEQYVQTAVALSRDIAALAELRAQLRGRLEQSPLMDETRYARNLEAAFRFAWENAVHF